MSTTEDQRFTEVYSSHYADVLGYLLRRSAADDARDVASEVFTVVWRRLDEMPTRAETLPWLYAVAANVLANRRRGERRRTRLLSRISGTGADQLIAPDPAVGSEQNGSLIAALNALSPRDREILLLNAWEGLPASQLARRFDISVSAAEKRLSRAKNRLAQALPQTELPTQEIATLDIPEATTS